MSIGRYQLGDYVPLSLQTTDQNLLSTIPDADPAIKLYRNGTLVTTTTMSVLDPNRAVEQYVLRYQPNNLGSWIAVMTYALSAITYTKVESFLVVAGGNSTGAIVAAHSLRLPGHDYVVCQADGGTLRYGRNPY
jgi:hypothetical protein